MSNPKILITSAAGNTGIPTTLELLKLGYPVRAFVRSNDHRAKQLKAAGAEIFVGDLYSITDMRRAMEGIKRAYHCAPTAPNALHFGSVFAIAAQEAKLEHVVMLGQWLAHPDHPSISTREIWMNEQLLRLLPETTLTVNNVGWFAQNYFMAILATIAQLGILPMPLGDGNIKNNAPPSNSDIAAVNVAALVNPQVHAGNVYRPTGPELLSPNEIAKIMGRVLGRKVRYQNIPEWMMLKALKAAGFEEMMPTQLRIYAEEYRRGTFAIHAPNQTIKNLTGREAESFEALTRNLVATRLEANRTFGNKLKAFIGFMKIPFTFVSNPDQIENRRGHVLLKSPDYSNASAAWLSQHDPGAGYIPDQPLSELESVSLVKQSVK